MEKLGILTAADYFWNQNSYNANKSLWIAMNKVYGKELAIKLLYFNDAYFGLKEVCQKIENNGLQHKNLRVAKNFENALNNSYSEFEQICSNGDLIKELGMYKNEILKKYNALLSTVE